MFTLSNNTGAIVLVDSGGHLQMCVSPVHKKVNTAVNYLLMNCSTTEFVPVVANSETVNHFTMIHSRTDMPNFVLKGALSNTDQLSGPGITDPHK